MPDAEISAPPAANPARSRRSGRRSASIATLLALLASLFVLVPAQAASAASAPLLPIGPNGAVTATASDASSGVTYLAGSFTRWGVQSGSGAAVASDGTVQRAFPAVAGGSVLASAPDGAGGFYIGGTFTIVGGESHQRIAHILGDGTVDSTWTPGASDAVRAIAVVGSTVYLGGSFTAVTTEAGGTVTRLRLAAFGSDGSLRTWAPSASSMVFALAATDSTVYVGGGFTAVTPSGGVAASRSRLAAFSTAGTGALTDWAPAADWNVTAMALSGSTLFIGGSFNRITPVGGSATDRGRLAAIATDTTGTLGSWAPSVDGSVSALDVVGVTIYIGGSFTTMSGGVGAAKPRASIGAVGTGGTGALRDFAPTLNGSVSAITTVGDELVVGGAFTSVTPVGGSATGRDRLAAFALSSGALDGWNPGADGSVSTVAAAGSTAFVGGAFTMLGGSVRTRLAALDSTGTLTSWAPTVNNTVNAIAVADSRVFVGGSFTTATGMGGVSTNRTYLAAFSVDAAALTSWAPISNGSINTFAVVGSTLYMGGPFSYITPVGGSGTLRYNLAGVSTTGTGTLSALTVGFDDAVRTLKYVGDTLYVGGSFTQARAGSGSWNTRRRAAAVTLSGSGSLTSWAPSFDNAVNAIVVADTTVYLGGSFTQVYVNNAWVPRNRVAAVTTAGVLTDWKPAFNDRVDSLLLSGTKLYVGGAFTSVTPSGGSATVRNRLALVGTADLGTLATWAPSADGAVSVLQFSSASELLIAGSFSTITGTGVSAGSGLARAAITLPPAAPGAPTLVTAGADNLTVTWAPPTPVWNPVTGYDVTYARLRTGPYITPTSGSCATTVAGTSCVIAGLSPASPYFVKVAARNADGASETSERSVALQTLPAGSGPGVPTEVLATPGDTTIGLSWAPPATTGGRSISGYRVCLDANCTDVAADSRSRTYSSLTNGESHDVSVAAITVDGMSAAVVRTSAARTVPSAPSVTASNPSAGTVRLEWSAPSSDGGSTITGYRVCLSGAVCQNIDPSVFTATFSGVANIAYSPSVVAINAAGNSTPGTGSITPITAPAAPTPVAMTVGNTTVTVGWSGSTGTGGSAITGYSVCLDSTCRDVSSSTTSSQFTGLTNGVSHTATVTATNSWGTSSPARGYIATGTAVAAGANLSGKDLHGWNLSGFNLTNTNFGGANLTGADLSGATFTGTSLRNANLTDARIVNSNLSGMNGEGLAYTTLTRTDFTGSDLRVTWVNFFQWAAFDHTNLTNANLAGVRLDQMGGNLPGVIFTGANLRGVTFGNAKLSGVNLAGFDLTNTTFGGANLTGADLSGATFAGASLRNANLTDAKIRNSDLSGMNGEGLAYTTLTRTDFSGSDLRVTWVNFFQWAAFDHTNLTNANLAGVRLDQMGGELPGVNFTGANLRGVTFGNAKLSGVNFAGFDLTNTTFGGADLTGADLSGATFTGTSLRNANLTDAKIIGADLSGMNGEGLAYTNLTRTDFTGSDLRVTWVNFFQWTTFDHTNLTNANLAGVRLDQMGGNLPDVIFTGANLRGVIFGAAKLSGANFAGFDLTDASFGGANLTGADLSGAIFKNTSLRSANLTDAKIRNSDLSGMNGEGLAYTNLTRTDFTGSDLRVTWVNFFQWTTFDHTNLTNANLAGVRLDQMGGNLPGVIFTGANLRGVIFGAAKLSGANFAGFDLTNTSFGGANLTGADLSGATFTNTSFRGANLTGARFVNSTLGSLAGEGLAYTNLTRANFTGADLRGIYSSVMQSAVINATDFTNARLDGIRLDLASRDSSTVSWATTKLTGASIKGTYFDYVNFTGFDFSGFDLTGTRFLAANLTNADLSGTNLTNATFYLAKAPGANFSGATTTGATWQYADLTEARFFTTVLKDTQSNAFGQADLTRTNFTGADLRNTSASFVSNASINATSFRNARLDGVRFDQVNRSSSVTNWASVKFTGASLAGAWFDYQNMAGRDFSGFNLTGVRFLGGDVSGADFSGADLTNATFYQANATAATFSAATTTGTTWQYANLTDARFVNTVLKNGSSNSFWQANLNRADFTGADLRNTGTSYFYNASVKATNFTNARLDGVRFDQVNRDSSVTNWASVILTGATLTSTWFDYQNLSGRNFAGFNLTGVRFVSSDVSNANFTGADLTNASFYQSTSTGATFSGATTTGTTWQYANLTNSKFRSTVLKNGGSNALWQANLTGADFTGADLRNANWTFIYNATVNTTDFTDARLDGIRFDQVNSASIPNSKFPGANLTGANLTNVTFGNGIFTGANLTGITINSGTNFSTVTGLGATGTGISGTTSQLPSMWRITSGTLYVTRAPSDAPAITGTTVGDGSITVNWSAPGANTGDTITGYVVCVASSCSNLASSARTATISGLSAPGTRTVTVAATNAGGASPQASTTAAPRTVPSIPVLGTTTVADGALTLNWSAPTSDGGYAISGYRACVGASCQDLDASATSVTFSGLTGGTQYTLRVRASNALGTSADGVTTAYPSPFLAPSLPTITSASVSGSNLSLSWRVPASTGGAAITGYTVCFDIPLHCRDLDGNAGSLTVKLDELTSVFSVRATNSVGTSPASRGTIINGSVIRAGGSYVGRDLHDADLSRLDLTGIDLRNANLNGADLTGSVLVGARLAGADLTDARLNAADLSGAVATGATMTGIRMNSATIDTTTDFRSVSGTGAAGLGIVGVTTLLPDIWSLNAGRLLVMVEPSAPKILDITQSSHTIDVTWDVPTNDGGGVILGYRICVVSGSCLDVTGSRRTATLTGITNGATYSVTVSARNAAGSSPVDTGSITLPGAPSAPRSVETTAGAGSIDVRWAAPSSTGGDRITGYSVCAAATCVPAIATDRAARITGLTNGTGYAVSVVAINGYGTSAPNTDAGTVVPFTTPSAPTITSVVGTDQTLTVNWTAGFNGGSALTGHRVCVTRSIGRPICVSASGSVRSIVVPGLVNGARYDVALTATNIAGGVTVTSTGVPSTIPDIPNIVSASRRPGAVDLVWEAPRFDGGAALVKYQLCAGSTCVNVGAAATTGSITGLTNGLTYALTVKAFNVHGASDSESASIELPGAPSAPEVRSVVGADGSLTIRWGTPSSTGGSPLTGYRVCVGTTCASVDAAVRSRTVTGLTNGTSYAVTVSASTAYGTSSTGSGSGTPFTIPSAPSITSVTGADRSLTVNWTAGSNGGAALIGYDICASPPDAGPGRRVCAGADGAVTSATITSLLNGIEYTVTLTPRNPAGSGAGDDATGVPSTVPDVVPTLVATPRAGAVDVSWTAPLDDGGAEITGYSVCVDTTCRDLDADATSVRFEGLSNGTRYTASVRARNMQGLAEAVSRSFTPRLLFGS